MNRVALFICYSHYEKKRTKGFTQLEHKLRIVVDESVESSICAFLLSEGHEIIDIAKDFTGITDKHVIKIANQHKSVILTEDKDFGELVFRSGFVTHGILLLRLFKPPTNEKNRIITSVLEQLKEEIYNSFCVISDDKIRVRSILKY